MKKLFSARYSASAINGAMFVLRVGLGILMLKIGYDKLDKFATLKNEFGSYFGMSSTVSLSLVIFAEFFCSALLIIGLMTRLATIPLIITMCVIVFKVSNADVFGNAMTATLFLIGYIAILIAGPGKASVDGMISK